jgi:hypothetical protein
LTYCVCEELEKGGNWELIMNKAIFALLGVAITSAAYLFIRDKHPQTEASGTKCIPLTQDNTRIENRGRYCFTGNLALKKGLVVAADFVTIDLMGHELSGPVGDTNTVGISAKDVSNLRITNGKIRGFGIGAEIYTDPHDSKRGYHQVDGVYFHENSQSALRISGQYARVLNNFFRDIGGGTLLKTIHTHGVIVTGPGAIIKQNTFENIYGSDITKKTEGIALAVSGYINGALITNNTFKNSTFLPSGRWRNLSPSTYAVWIGGNGQGSATAFGNTLENYVNGIIADYHITTSIIGNHAKNVAIPFSLREARREFGKKDAAGASGYIPDDNGNNRPFGDVAKSNNTCETDNEKVKQLANLKTVENCIGDYDISFDELISALRPTT